MAVATSIIIVRAGNQIRGGDAANIPSGFGRADTLTSEDAEAIGDSLTWRLGTR